MPKILNLVYNPLQDVYYFFEGSSQRPQRRSEYKVEDLIDGLSEQIDFKRKSFLRLSGISGEIFDELYSFFKGTKVSLEKKSKL